MTERDKLRICKALTKRLANIDLKSSDINIVDFEYKTVINREGYTQYCINSLDFDNGIISFAYFGMLDNFVIYGNLNRIEGTPIIADTSYKVYVNEITQYIDGKPKYKMQMHITYTPTDKEPYTVAIF